MIRPVVTGNPILSPVLLIGQAPGVREGPLGKPFAWTAGKTMFGWFSFLGLPEDQFRERIYMSAVCRCFPGKAEGGGDRVPSDEEVARCGKHLAREMQILRPRLVIPVGKLAIEQLVPDMEKLVEIVGVQRRVSLSAFPEHQFDMIALPHPSGASTWHRTEPGKTLLVRALSLIAQHEAFGSLLDHEAKIAAAERPFASLDLPPPSGETKPKPKRTRTTPAKPSRTTTTSPRTNVTKRSSTTLSRRRASPPSRKPADRKATSRRKDVRDAAESLDVQHRRAVVDAPVGGGLRDDAKSLNVQHRRPVVDAAVRGFAAQRARRGFGALLAGDASDVPASLTAVKVQRQRGGVDAADEFLEGDGVGRCEVGTADPPDSKQTSSPA
jgi:uracil-DNA glycosylase